MQEISSDYLTHYFEIARYKWIFVLSIGLFMSFFLLAFQPFGVNNFDPAFHISLEFVLVISSFGLVVSAALAISEFLLRPMLFRNLTRAQLIGWLAWDYLMVATVVFVFYNFLGDWHDLRWSSYFGFIRDIALVMSFPVAAFLFYIRHESLKSEFIQLRSLKIETPSSGMVHFSSDNGKDRIAVALEDLLYLESQDNYVAVVYMDNAVRRGALIRSSLKRLEDTLSQSTLIRCHRSFIVNLSRIRSCQGNRHGLKLTLDGADQAIPVSRAYTQHLLQALNEGQAPA